MIQKFKRKVLKVGQGKENVTVDEHFQNLSDEIKPYKKQVQNLAPLLDKYVSFARGMFECSQELVAMCSSDHGTSNSEDDSFWEKVSEAHTTISTESVQKLQRAIDNSMLNKVGELRDTFKTLKHQIHEREEARSQMDYYRHKEKLLTASNEKLKAEGKEISDKQKNKVERTRQNLESKISEYEQLNGEAVGTLEEIHTQKNEWMSTIIKRFVKIEQTFATEINNTLSPIDLSRLSNHEIIYTSGNSMSDSGLVSNNSSSILSQPGVRKGMNSSSGTYKSKQPPPSHRPTSQKNVPPPSYNDQKVNASSTDLASSMMSQQVEGERKTPSGPPSGGPPSGGPPSGYSFGPPSGPPSGGSRKAPPKVRPPGSRGPPPQLRPPGSPGGFTPPSPKVNIAGKRLGLKDWTIHATAGYEGVKIKNMSSSWKDGLAFAALISAFRPDLIDFDSLPDDALERLNIAFAAAEQAGVTMLLDADDVVDYADQKCIKTQLAMYQKTLGNAVMKGKRG